MFEGEQNEYGDSGCRGFQGRFQRTGQIGMRCVFSYCYKQQNSVILYMSPTVLLWGITGNSTSPPNVIGEVHYIFLTESSTCSLS